MPRLRIPFLGKILLVGITHIADDGSVIEQQQFFGEVQSAHHRQGILLNLAGRRAGEQYNLPLGTRSINAAFRVVGRSIVRPAWLAAFSAASAPESSRHYSKRRRPMTFAIGTKRRSLNRSMPKYCSCVGGTCAIEPFSALGCGGGQGLRRQEARLPQKDRVPTVDRLLSDGSPPTVRSTCRTTRLLQIETIERCG